MKLGKGDGWTEEKSGQYRFSETKRWDSAMRKWQESHAAESGPVR